MSPVVRQYVDYLTLEDLMRVAKGHGTTVVDAGLLASAVARPQTTVGGQDAYPTLEEKAAAYIDSLNSNHALADGNKRMSLGAAVVFLTINGYAIDLDEQAKGDLILEVAAGALRGVRAIAPRLPIRPM